MTFSSYEYYIIKQARDINCGKLVEINICVDLLNEALQYWTRLEPSEVNALESMYNRIVG